MVLEIRKYGDPVLRQKADMVTAFDEKLARLAADMMATMEAASGVGLAGNQVGVLKQIFVADTASFEITGSKLAVVNPEIVFRSSEEAIEEEGCLSIPGVYAEVRRPKKIKLAGRNLKGEKMELDAEDMIARVFCHETDHLNGVLFIDRLSALERDLLKGKLSELKKKAAL
ncbi:MAG: peptide deformylase [candidate division Zixibacteria bacterium]|nr:peptide deformylase [candidate division Zixibacteria bacterium]MCI0597021.1 peptide deformylase [candidate division Zixibacteria bacterium]